MGRNKKLETFRITATPDQWRGLVRDHDDLASEEFHTKYGFSWSSIYQNAVAGGYYSLTRAKRSHQSAASDIESSEKKFPRS